MMTRSCSACGAKKTGDAALIDPMTAEKHTNFWKDTHLPGCKYMAMTPAEQLADFMENGSPVSSVDEG